MPLKKKKREEKENSRAACTWKRVAHPRMKHMTLLMAPPQYDKFCISKRWRNLLEKLTLPNTCMKLSKCQIGTLSCTSLLLCLATRRVHKLQVVPTYQEVVFSKSSLANQFCDSVVLWFRVEAGRPGSNPDPTTYLINWTPASTAIEWDTYSKQLRKRVREKCVPRGLVKCLYLSLCIRGDSSLGYISQSV